MPSKIAQRRVRNHLRDITSLESLATRASVIFCLMLRKRVAASFLIREDVLWECVDPFILLLTKAMVCSHLTGRHRSYLTAGAGFLGATDVYRRAMHWAKQRAKLSEDDLKRLEAMYSQEATKIAVGFDQAVNQKLNQAAQRIIARGHHTREGRKLMQKAFEAAGVGRQNPHLAATLTRTQTQMAYNAGRWEANQDPALDEIIWGYEYITIEDARTRPEHSTENGQRKPKDDPYWNSYWPPCGYNCRCTTIEIFKNEHRRTKSTELAEVVRIRGKDVTRRVDPGFNFHPGRVYSQGILPTTLPPTVPIRPPPAVVERFVIAKPGGGKWTVDELTKLLGETTDPKEKKWIRSQLRRLGHKGGLKGAPKVPTPRAAPTPRVPPTPTPTPPAEPGVSLEVMKGMEFEQGGNVVKQADIRRACAQEYHQMRQQIPWLKLPRNLEITSHDWVRRTGVTGSYEYHSQTLSIADGKGKFLKRLRLRRGAFTVSRSGEVAGTFRHEMGHFVHDQMIGLRGKRNWRDVCEILELEKGKKGAARWWESNLSKYAAKDRHEAFAESFCYYMHPEYGTKAVPRLADELHAFFAKALPKKALPKALPKVAEPGAVERLRFLKTVRGQTGISSENLGNIRMTLGEEAERLQKAFPKISTRVKGVSVRKGLWAEEKGVCGIYKEEQQRIVLGDGKKLQHAGQVTKGKWSVTEADDIAGTYRHEIGHHVYDTGLTPESRVAWDDLMTKMGKVDPNWWVKNLSEYGASVTVQEGFAEAFCYFSHPQYGTAAVSKLAPEIHQFMTKVLLT